MNTLTQVFYNKIAVYPREWYQSKDGRIVLAKIARMIKQKEGRTECKYFLQLVTINACI